MCVNYIPPKPAEIVPAIRAVMRADQHWPDEIWQDYAAPIIRTRSDIPAPHAAGALNGIASQPAAEVALASYGIVPKRHIPPGITLFSTMNARAETITEKRSFSTAWRNGQTCLIPMKCFFEPNYESGRSERWSIAMADDATFCVAGLWREWEEPDGGTALAFTQITINADRHPLMRRFFKPGEEKRSLVIVPPAQYDAWLACRNPGTARSMLTLYPAEQMRTWAAPRAINGLRQAGVSGSLF
ncbi:SOS response-associated peptidase family protein [Herbaspirillum autotrophicum]|uniref:SOS response-associated peptidase family protein n=1 Tax=Herbaspirillum autotrophicum TaxID=180195 RepID=UPI00067DF5AD|nr:SOS response-associated peptidase family protein [Herbaspirillum autotrophicum]